MRPLVLWDIDGTLVRSGPAVGTAFNAALRAVYELAVEPHRISFAGKTDHQIVLEVLRHHAIDETRALERLAYFERHYHDLVQAAAGEVAREIRILPGVPTALEVVEAGGGSNTLLTGNLRPVAEIKLRAAGLYDCFQWESGAFGSDDWIRDRLVGIAEAKARAGGLAFDRTVVVGDTPLDIQCARAGKARVVAVATGTYSLTELQACQPDVALENLSDTAAICAAIFGAMDEPHK